MKKPGGIEKVLSVWIAIGRGRSDDYAHAGSMGFDFLNGSITTFQKIFEFQKITWRISANRHFRKNGQVGTTLFCLVNTLDDLFSIEFKISNMIILLNQRDLHETNLLL